MSVELQHKKAKIVSSRLRRQLFSYRGTNNRYCGITNKEQQRRLATLQPTRCAIPYCNRGPANMTHNSSQNDFPGFHVDNDVTDAQTDGHGTRFMQARRDVVIRRRESWCTEKKNDLDAPRSLLFVNSSSYCCQCRGIVGQQRRILPLFQLLQRRG